MNKKYLLLEYLIGQEDFKSSNELADILNVSSKTITRYIKDLNEILYKFGFEIQSKQGFGYGFNISKSDRLLLKKIYQNNLLALNNVDENFFNIFRRLLIVKKYTSLQLSNEMFLSESNVYKELRKIKTYINEYQLDLRTNESGKIEIIGDYEKKVQCILNYMHNLPEEKSKVFLPLIKHSDNLCVYKNLQEYIINNKYVISDMDLNFLRDLILVCVNEIRSLKISSIYDNKLDEKIDQWQKNKDEWNEKPISINPLQTYVMLKNKDNHSISVFPKGVREYEIIDNQKIYITLFRTYSHMGKENLLYRPGRASGEKIIKTPDAQLIGEFKTELSTSYGMTINETVKMGKRINTQIYAYQYGEFLNGRLIFSLEYQKPDLSSDLELLKFKNNQLKLNAFKPSENYDGYIMRLVNSSDKQISEVIDLSGFNQYSIYKSNILEEKISNMIFDKSLEVKLDPNKFLTLLLIKNKSN